MTSSIAIKNKSVTQIVKFLFIGALNTAVDFSVLNLLILLVGTSENSWSFSIFKSISFIVAVVNSYIFNKFWVFKDSQNYSKIHEGFLFFCVSGVGFLLNVLISTLVYKTALVNLGLGNHVSANIGAVLGSVIVLIWNYSGYKLIVFKK